MSKVYLDNLENDIQWYKRDIVAGFPSPQRYVPIIRYAIEKCMMEDVDSIDAVCIKVVHTPTLFYFGSKYALRYMLRRTGNAIATYVRVPYPDVGVYFRAYRDYGVDNFFHLLVANTMRLKYNFICRISVEIVKNLDSDTHFYERNLSYLCEL